jgi:DNA polymerase I-like protein with 3'-5' exonuclease and polymerase domains
MGMCARCSGACGRFPDIESRNQNQRGFAERTAINTPLQGTAADMIKLAMIVQSTGS